MTDAPPRSLVARLRDADAHADALSPDDHPMESVAPCPLAAKVERASAPLHEFALFLQGRDGPYRGVPYALHVDGQKVSAPAARTPDDGLIRHEAHLGSAVLLEVWFDPHENPERYRFVVAPLADAPGGELVGRLRNLGAWPMNDTDSMEVLRKRFSARFGGTVESTARQIHRV